MGVFHTRRTLRRTTTTTATILLPCSVFVELYILRPVTTPPLLGRTALQIAGLTCYGRGADLNF